MVLAGGSPLAKRQPSLIETRSRGEVWTSAACSAAGKAPTRSSSTAVNEANGRTPPVPRR